MTNRSPSNLLQHPRPGLLNKTASIVVQRCALRTGMNDFGLAHVFFPVACAVARKTDVYDGGDGEFRSAPAHKAAQAHALGCRGPLQSLSLATRPPPLPGDAYPPP